MYRVIGMDEIINNLWVTAMGSVAEINRLFPDSLIFGGLVLFFVTQNLAYRMFALLGVEVALVHWALQWVTDRIQPRSPANGEAKGKCVSGYRAARVELDRINTEPDRFPTFSALTLGTLASYLAAIMLSFKETLEAMGPEWTSRMFVAGIMSLLFIVYFISFRIYTGCETFGEITGTFVIGLLVGFVLYIINKSVLSDESMNVLGLPYLVDKNKDGEPIYICAPRMEA